jgi:DNA modification methylase
MSRFGHFLRRTAAKNEDMLSSSCYGFAEHQREWTSAKMATAAIHPNNKLNELTAAEWITRTVSVFVQRGLGSNSVEAKYEKLHPAPFSFTDVTRFVEFFTKKGGAVLDPFGGVASTAKAAGLIGRHATVVEINPEFARLADERLNAELPPGTARQLCSIICGDARTVKLDRSNYDLLLTSPPYWGILDKVDHKAKQERVNNGLIHNYGEVAGDLSRIGDYREFVDELATTFTKLADHVREGGHAVIIVGDFRHKSRYYMFHADLAARLEALGRWGLKGIKIMYQKHKRVFPYGYPYAYVPNLHHQYALVLQRTM